MLPLLSAQWEAARARLPAEVVDYYSAGSGGETTLGEASVAWASYRFRPRVLHDVSTVDLSTRWLGTPVASPVGIAPMAFHGLASRAGECDTVAGAGAAGCLPVVSTRASRSLEDIGAAAPGPWWFQAYVMRDRGLTEALVERAVAAGATAVVLTVDTPHVGRKHKVGGVRFSVPDDVFLVNLARHLRAGVGGRADAEQDPSVTPDYIARLADVGQVPVVVKGVLRGDEAERLVAAGAAGVVVSNHGGRQLDRAVPSAWALPEVVHAVAGRVPVFADGGIRSGLDVLAALALGARGVLLGRPVLWALAAGGAQAVADLLRALDDDLAHAMALVGARSVGDLDDSLVSLRCVPPWR